MITPQNKMRPRACTRSAREYSISKALESCEKSPGVGTPTHHLAQITRHIRVLFALEMSQTEIIEHVNYLCDVVRGDMERIRDEEVRIARNKARYSMDRSIVQELEDEPLEGPG